MSFLRTSTSLKKQFQFGMLSPMGNHYRPCPSNAVLMDRCFSTKTPIMDESPNMDEEVSPNRMARYTKLRMLAELSAQRHSMPNDASKLELIKEIKRQVWRDALKHSDNSYFLSNFTLESNQGIGILDLALTLYFKAVKKQSKAQIRLTQVQMNEIACLYFQALTVSRVPNFSYWFHIIFNIPYTPPEVIDHGLANQRNAIMRVKTRNSIGFKAEKLWKTKIKCEDKSYGGDESNREDDSRRSKMSKFRWRLVRRLFRHSLNIKDNVIKRYNIKALPTSSILSNIVQHASENNDPNLIYHYFSKLQKLYPDIFIRESFFSDIVLKFARKNQEQNDMDRQRAGRFIYMTLIAMKSINKGSYVCTSASYSACFKALTILQCPSQAFNNVIEEMEGDENFIPDIEVLTSILNTLKTIPIILVGKREAQSKIGSFSLLPEFDLDLVMFIRVNNIPIHEAIANEVVAIYSKVASLETTYRVIGQFFKMPKEIIQYIEDPSANVTTNFDRFAEYERQVALRNFRLFAQNPTVLSYLLRAACRNGFLHRAVFIANYLVDNYIYDSSIVKRSIFHSLFAKQEYDKALKYLEDNFNLLDENGNLSLDPTKANLSRFQTYFIINCLCTPAFPQFYSRKEQYSELLESFPNK